jgi:TM2 domain-containing membrane protein YozV
MWLHRMTDLSTLTDEQRQRFMTEVLSKRKNIVGVMLLTFFLGGIGAHKFYLGDNKKGIIYLLFCWTFIPSIIACFELPAVKRQIEESNDRLALEVFTKVQS